MFGMGSPWEIAFVGLIILLLFGGRRLPELGSGLGKAISNFKKSYQDNSAIDVTPDGDEKADEDSTSEGTDKDASK